MDGSPLISSASVLSSRKVDIDSTLALCFVLIVTASVLFVRVIDSWVKVVVSSIGIERSCVSVKRIDSPNDIRFRRDSKKAWVESMRWLQ